MTWELVEEDMGNLVAVARIYGNVCVRAQF